METIFDNLLVNQPKDKSHFWESHKWKFSGSTLFPYSSTPSVFGVEIEVENAKNFLFPEMNSVWNVVEDHSLRNNGREFISIPLPNYLVLQQVEWLLQLLQTKNVSFHPRAGIHIHANIRDFSYGDLKKLVLSYFVLEDLFFDIASIERRYSNFSCPLQEQEGKLYNYLFNPASLDIEYFKYSAFNLVPFQTKGTVEFRHLPSVPDFTVFRSFFELVDFLVNSIRENELAVKEFLFSIPDLDMFKSFRSQVETSYPKLINLLKSAESGHKNELQVGDDLLAEEE